MTEQPERNDGWVAVRATGGRVLLHLAKPPFGQRTLCGRYTSDRYLPEDTAATGERCEVCRMNARGAELADRVPPLGPETTAELLRLMGSPPEMPDETGGWA